ncbi:hypothetical protein BDW72DRAFT_127482 [Aspergillus terricola var. indicus]
MISVLSSVILSLVLWGRNSATRYNTFMCSSVLFLVLIISLTSFSTSTHLQPLTEKTFSYPVCCRRRSAAQRIRLGRYSLNANRGGSQRSL